jgi:hypothetical protein
LIFPHFDERSARNLGEAAVLGSGEDWQFGKRVLFGHQDDLVGVTGLHFGDFGLAFLEGVAVLVAVHVIMQELTYKLSLGMRSDELLALALKGVVEGLDGGGEGAGGGSVCSVAAGGVSEAEAQVEDEVCGHQDEDGEQQQVECLLGGSRLHYLN